jgi:hypothetical protein
MKINLSTRKSKLIILIALFVIFAVSGGYLLWRINQPETVAPEEGEAASCDGYTYKGAGGCEWISISSSVKCCSNNICNSNASSCSISSPGTCLTSSFGNPLEACSFCVDGTWKNSIPGGCYKSDNYCWMTCSKPSPTPTYTLKYSAGTGGSISGSTTQTVKKGKSGSKVTAVPSSGYTFSKWSDGKTSASRTDTNVQKNITVKAQFTAITTKYHLTYTAGTGGKISGSTKQIVERGKSGSKVTAIADTGHTFSRWSDGKTSASRTDTNVQRDINVTAQFTANKYTVTYNANGGICTPSSRTIEHQKSATAPSCTRSGYSLTGFTRTSGSGGNLDTTTGAITNVTGDQTIRADWIEILPTQYIVTYNANGGTCTPPSRIVESGDNAAAPSCTRLGYTLSGFTRTSGSGGNLDTTTGAITNVTGDQTIRADWEIKTYTLNYSAGDNGTLEGNTSQTVNHGSSGTAVTANPDEGYFFGGWSDGKAENTRTDTGVTGDIAVTATFSLSCGNGTCEADENNENCPVDCDPECGDGYCNPETENAQNCKEDCDADCGDGYCTHDETNETCPEDCSADCGDGYCDPATENSSNCPADCGPATTTSVPETGVFDEVETSVLVGLGLLFLGFTWRILGRGIYISISILGKFPRKVSIHLKDIQQERRLKKDIKRKQKFEKKVVKDS